MTLAERLREGWAEHVEHPNWPCEHFGCNDVDDLLNALRGMVYLYDRFGFDQTVRANTDPVLDWLNIILRAKQLTDGVPFTPPADLAVVGRNTQNVEPRSDRG